MDIREATITAQMPAGEFFVIDPHEVENGCVQIVNVHWVLYRTTRTPCAAIRRANRQPSAKPPYLRPPRSLLKVGSSLMPYKSRVLLLVMI